jgi:hypothetical protein
LRLEGYPQPHTGERVDGFVSPNQLRLVLHPPAWRFFLLGLHTVLGAPGVWPTAPEVMMSSSLRLKGNKVVSVCFVARRELARDTCVGYRLYAIYRLNETIDYTICIDINMYVYICSMRKCKQ